MCGIAGSYGKSNKNLLIQILDKQNKRGPDGREIWISPDRLTMLGHDRLAIMDPEGGKQPLCNEKENIWAVVNGEIYNYKELRASLETRHQFRTNSDSEIVLHLYEEKGPDMVKDLDGMFSFAIWDGNHLFLARDPIGIKPLYYGFDKWGVFYFASEIKALTKQIGEIYEFPNGHYMFAGSSPIPYYQFPTPKNSLVDVTRACEQVKNTLEHAVIKRLMADVPLGVFLSGGLDSSLISAIVKKHTQGELHSFAVGIENSLDILRAREVAQYLGTIHHERQLSPDEIINSLPEVIYALESCDPALIRSAIPNFYVSELAARNVKVVLSGEGADELFGGYHYLSQYKKHSHVFSDELLQITRSLHNSNLQRADRLSMYHGLEARVPFLDIRMIELAFNLSPELKNNGVEKWILRKIAEDYLPSDIAWRKKEKFSVGTGIAPILQTHAEKTITNRELQDSIGPSGKRFRSKEELLYWKIFKSHYGREDILTQMGRSKSLNPGELWESAL
jgi:asparagine synthase (glutamine-hydrolysing)